MHAFITVSQRTVLVAPHIDREWSSNPYFHPRLTMYRALRIPSRRWVIVGCMLS